jgi:hypothetical protein
MRDEEDRTSSPSINIAKPLCFDEHSKAKLAGNLIAFSSLRTHHASLNAGVNRKEGLPRP